ncbi:hypothetical protein HS125_19800 [bacterium]|nr:hypothetical protein [bacterium]
MPLNATKLARRMAVLLLPLALIACRTGGGSGARMELAEVGLSMSAPAGWSVSQDAPAMCSKGDYTGVVIAEPLQGLDFNQRVDTLARAQNSQIIAKTSTTISGRPAVEAVLAYPDTGVRAMKAYIHKGDKLIEVSFVASEADFPKYESAFRASMASIRIQ